ncbi:hypothetical protein [Rubripirellula obstinata]|uniref:hypothetical protein n=1 Tax=Rubripirellula obstinata TaxID=406547 RepID=UPI0012FBB8AD|nr:hypothetical protein [Rubripirellula obstinata]
MQQVADGEISLQQATGRLLDRLPESQRETEFESLASLTQRLGEPPVEVIDHWCFQLRQSLQTSSRHEVQPAIEKFKLDDFEVTSDGQIRFVDDREGEINAVDQAKFSPEQIEQFVVEFRDRLVGREVDLNDQVPRDQVPNDQITEEQNKNLAWPKIAVIAGTLLCGGALLWILSSNSTTTIAESNNDENDPSPATPKGVFADFPSTRATTGFAGNDLFAAIDSKLANPQRSVDSVDSLESLESISDEEISLLEADQAPSFSLESMMPGMPSPVAADLDSNDLQEPKSGTAVKAELPDVSKNPDDEPESSQDNAGDADNAGNESAMQLADETESDERVLSDNSLDANEPDELQQATRSVTSTAIQLPPMDQVAPMILDDQFPGAEASKTLTLTFPDDTELSIKPTDDSGVWNIVNDKGTRAIGIIDATTNNLTFAWAADAAKIAGARSLHHGRLSSGDGSAFFLRPKVQAEPWSIRLDQPDMRPTWNLTAPIPPSVSRMSVEIDLPEELEMTWVEPIPIDSPRRARGLAIIKPLDSESVDLAIKFDVRCSRKLSCRLRYAARLDSSMPWQLVSRDSLELFANQLAGRAELVSREADRLQNVYDMAGSRGKRIIRIKQKYNDGLADSLRQYADRIAELQSLVASVESGAAIRFRVWVMWPSGQEQTLFTNTEAEDLFPAK